MKLRRVRFTTTASSHVDRERAWWLENRDHRALFAIELERAVEILALLQRLNREGLTIVLVTHEPDIAAYASRVLLFRDGRLRSDERA